MSIELVPVIEFYFSLPKLHNYTCKKCRLEIELHKKVLLFCKKCQIQCEYIPAKPLKRSILRYNKEHISVFTEKNISD